MSKQQIGVVGMAVMGRNLALNIESRGYTVSVFNRSRDKTEEVIAENPGKKLVPFYTVKEFVESLETPRRILLMVKAGAGTDAAIDSLKPYLEKGDIIIDGGNTFFQDTIRRNRELSAEGFNFIGTGVSGGEEGALKGPSIMPGGQKEAYELVAPILTKIAAVAEDGEPCVTYIGPDGAGHYVKMVHNGIEYGDMQLIAEAYSLLKGGLNLSNEELAETFTEWNKGELNSYLIDITKDIFTKKDEEGKYLVDVILDEAANKGTGKWTSQSSLDLGEPLSLITESVFARYISSLKDQRVAASKVLSGPQAKPAGDKAEFVEKVRRALYLGKIVSYAQGFSQLRAASDENNWDLNYGEIAKIFRAGCIIRAQFLQKITDAYAIRRNRELSAEGFNFIGTGVSGGEEGALKGPSIMPGGQKEAYELVAPILTKIAAVAEDGEPCVTYIGPDGAGHYVKMVHNGIEYGDMQLIAEAYSLLKGGLNLSNEELAETFTEWNKGELNSYLIDITKDIFTKKDEEGKYLVDVILDEAANKGTGKWTSQSSLDLGEPLSLITESVFARYISSLKDQRVAASKVLSGPQAKPAGDKAEFVEKVRRALYLGKIVSYAQGFSQLRAASDENNWDLNYGEIAKIFRAGCIIRAQFLQKITDAYAENAGIANLLLAPYFKKIADEYQQALRDVVAYAVQNGIPVPTFSAAVAYYDSYRAAVLPANLIQAQRDYFGAHTYKRTDKEGVFHTEWLD